MKAPKKISESDIQRTICDYLDRKKHFFWRANNTPIYDPTRKQFRAMPKYAIRGLPDITIITDGGFAVFLEVKKPKGTQSEHQKEFQRRCKEKGCEYHVVKSLEDVIELGL